MILKGFQSYLNTKKVRRPGESARPSPGDPQPNIQDFKEGSDIGSTFQEIMEAVIAAECTRAMERRGIKTARPQQKSVAIPPKWGRKEAAPGHTVRTHRDPQRRLPVADPDARNMREISAILDSVFPESGSALPLLKIDPGEIAARLEAAFPESGRKDPRAPAPGTNLRCFLSGRSIRSTGPRSSST